MSLFQSLVLLMFNDGDEFTLEDIRQATGIGVCKGVQYNTGACTVYLFNLVE